MRDGFSSLCMTENFIPEYLLIFALYFYKKNRLENKEFSSELAKIISEK